MFDGFFGGCQTFDLPFQTYDLFKRLIIMLAKTVMGCDFVIDGFAELLFAGLVLGLFLHD